MGFRRPGCADQPLTAIVRCHGRRSIKLTPFTTFGVSQRASTDIPRCLRRLRLSGAVPLAADTIHRAAQIAVKVRPVIHDGSFSGTCCTAVMAYVPSSFSRYSHSGTGAGATSATSAPIRVSGNAVRNTAHFYLHAVGDGWTSTLTGLPLPSTRLISVVRKMAA